MEPPERLAEFEENRGKGWKEEYIAYRSHWSEWPKKQILSRYPLHVDIELSTVCNLNCPMCYTTTEEFKQRIPRKFMDINLFKKIIDEIGGRVPAIRLSLRGESTLHPKFVECVRYAKEKGIHEVSFLTNLSTMTVDFFIAVAEAGADWITVSIDGLGAQYEAIRKPLKFSDTLDKIKSMHAIKQKRQWYRPVIKVQGIWPAIRENPTAFYNIFAPITDLVAFNPLIDYLDNDENIVYEPGFSCPQLYQRLVIGSDGNVMVCSNDEKGQCIVGNVTCDSIQKIWSGGKMASIRQLHLAGHFFEMELCRFCYLPRMTIDDEIVSINGRKLVIKNYVGRSQIIGK